MFMSVSLYDIEQAVLEANRQLNRVRDNASSMVDLITGNLRHVPAYKLKRLKKELRDFNMHTGEWKS